MSIARKSVAHGSQISRWLSDPVKGSVTRLAEQKWICSNCRNKLGVKQNRGIIGQAIWKRAISSTARRRDDIETRRPINPSTKTTTQPSKHKELESNTPASSSTSLPSHSASKRSEISQRTSKILDTLLARASIASQQINQYTGTDYSGIEALQKEITDQESRLKSLHSAVEDAKSKHHEAYEKQASAKSEIVALLERKSSWSATDLEKYMSLVRSEHLNDQDVQKAKDNLAAAEHELEDVRSLIEGLERKKYHEEQIWSDTIRRNSTWVTFGLMGVNILLLLTQIVIFEPYRRKKIVKEMQAALDERTVHAVPTAPAATVEHEVHAVPPASDLTTERILTEAERSPDTLPPATAVPEKEPLAASEILPDEAADFAVAVPSPSNTSSPPEISSDQHYPESWLPAANTWEAWQVAFRDLFSERMVQLRKVDVTNAALQGAASGVAIMGLLFVLFRPY